MIKNYSKILLAASFAALFIPAMTMARETNSSIRDQLRADYEARIQNLKNNQDTRNVMLQNRQRMMGTSTHPRLASTSSLWNASTSEYRQEMRNNKHGDMFRVQQNNFVRQLTVSLGNLKQIRARIGTSIAKATQNGKDMRAAKALLVSADTKIAIAEQAINSAVNLSTPRQSAMTASKALADAREALNAVIRAIARDIISE